MKLGSKDVKNMMFGTRQVKKVYKGSQVVWGVLPIGYTEVKYLQSSGTQYINTAFIPSSETKVEIQYYLVTRTYPSALFGSRNAIGSKEFCVFLNDNTTGHKFRFDYAEAGVQGNSHATSSAISYPNILYIITKDKEKNYVNGNADNSNPPQVFTGDYPIYLYCINTGGTTITGISIIRVHYCKLFDNDTLQRNFIPCLDTNNTPCFYDTVTGNSYYNQGTGQFGYETMDGTVVAPT